MLLTELIPAQLFVEMAQKNYIKEQVHPEFKELRILNYTPAAAYDGVWNEVTLQCRGLIYDLSTMKIISRPFPKFFNYGQAGCPEIDMNAQVVVMDKMDGSLGILYKTPVGGYAIATRGSFASDQAIHATKILNEKYSDWLKDSRNQELFQEFTPMFEIIYPENRIVCDYKGMDDLVLLDAVNIETGDSWGSSGSRVLFDWKGPEAEEFEYISMAEALKATPRTGAEGFVVLFTETNERVKIKQEDYVALHRIVTGLNARTVWEYASQHRELNDLLAELPDEFHEWVRDTYDDLCDKFDNLLDQIDIEYDIIKNLTDNEAKYEQISFGSRDYRKLFAGFASTSPFKGFMFQYLDGKNISSKIWEMVKPKADVTPSGRTFTEDNS